MKSPSNDRRPVVERERDASSPEFAGGEIPGLPKQSPRVNPTFETESPGAEDFWSEMEAISERAHALAPEEHTWGFYGFSDGPVIAGGGTGGFLWFESREQMFEFVERYLPFWCPGPDRGDAREVAAKVRDILAGPLTSDEALRTMLNDTLKGYAQLGWWGQFEDLLTTDIPFAREVRDWFRSNCGKKTGAGFVSREESHQFAEGLREYGI
jgi:hypothetical protein